MSSFSLSSFCSDKSGGLLRYKRGQEPCSRSHSFEGLPGIPEFCVLCHTALGISIVFFFSFFKKDFI